MWIFFRTFVPDYCYTMKHNLYSLLFLALCGIVLLAPACKSDGPDPQPCRRPYGTLRFETEDGVTLVPLTHNP